MRRGGWRGIGRGGRRGRGIGLRCGGSLLGSIRRGVLRGLLGRIWFLGGGVFLRCIRRLLYQVSIKYRYPVIGKTLKLPLL